MTDRPVISFVIPVRNDALRLRRCLSSIAESSRARRDVEVIVVDNGSTDASAAEAETAGARVIALPNIGVAQLRNDGAMAAHGRLIAFVDADHELDKGWIAAALELFDDQDVSAAGSPYDVPSDANWVQRTYDGLRRRSGAARCDVDWLPSGNLIVRKDAFTAIGGFDTSLQTCEDVDLCRRLRAAGSRIVSDPRLRSVHLGDPSSLTAVFLGELWRGRDNLKASLRRPISYAELPSIVIPLLDLVLLVAGAVALSTRSEAGIILCGIALTGFALLAAIRTVVILGRLAEPTAIDGVRAFAVAIVYDAARALALVAQTGHTVRRRG